MARLPGVGSLRRRAAPDRCRDAGAPGGPRLHRDVRSGAHVVARSAPDRRGTGRTGMTGICRKTPLARARRRGLHKTASMPVLPVGGPRESAPRCQRCRWRRPAQSPRGRRPCLPPHPPGGRRRPPTPNPHGEHRLAKLGVPVVDPDGSPRRTPRPGTRDPGSACVPWSMGHGRPDVSARSATDAVVGTLVARRLCNAAGRCSREALSSRPRAKPTRGPRRPPLSPPRPPARPRRTDDGSDDRGGDQVTARPAARGGPDRLRAYRARAACGGHRVARVFTTAAGGVPLAPGSPRRDAGGQGRPRAAEPPAARSAHSRSSTPSWRSGVASRPARSATATERPTSPP